MKNLTLVVRAQGVDLVKSALINSTCFLLMLYIPRPIWRENISGEQL